jgi:release factor glutamine methyltransferase
VSAATRPGDTVAGLLGEAGRILADAGVASPGLDARLLLARALCADQAALIRDAGARVASARRAAFLALVRRRAAREPVSRILGEREFYGRSFAIAPSVLDPRPDTETLVAAALERSAGRRHMSLRICDLGTGSGALIVTLLAELAHATGLAVDIDRHAVGVARDNARRHGVAGRCSFCVADWGDAVSGTFDLVVANPPYVARGAVAGLQPEVRAHDPAGALDGGADGLDGHRAVAAAAARLLDPARGTLLVEVGAGQIGPVARLLRQSGLVPAGPSAVARDLAGVGRVIIARKG